MEQIVVLSPVERRALCVALDLTYVLNDACKLSLAPQVVKGGRDRVRLSRNDFDGDGTMHRGPGQHVIPRQAVVVSYPTGERLGWFGVG